jgi:hypothetical protein
MLLFYPSKYWQVNLFMVVFAVFFWVRYWGIPKYKKWSDERKKKKIL